MRQFFRNKIFLLILLTIMTFVVMGISAKQNSRINWLNNVLSIPLSPVQRFISYAGQRTEAGLAFFRDIKETKQENEYLNQRVSELEKENRELLQFKEKNLELREALNLKGRFENYQLVGGNVIAKDPGNWFNIFKIDAGIKDGVASDLPVLTSSRGLVGRIITSDLTSSKVITIIDEDSVVSGWVSKTGGGPVRVRGDMALRDQGLCRVDYIPADVDVEVDDIVETSGLGGIYPKGILIGRVKEVRKTENELERYGIIKPAVDFKRLEEVFVLTNLDNENGDTRERK